MEETKRVGRSLMILLAALLLVYVIFFDVRGEIVYTPTTATNTTINANLSNNALTDSDIDRMIYIDRTRQLSNNPYSDDIYYDTSMIPSDKQNTAFADPKVLAQTQDTKKDPIIVQNNSQSNNQQVDNSLPAVVEDLQGRKFYSTDFLFGKTDTDDATNIGTNANPVGTLASTTGQTDPQTIVRPPSVPTSTPVATVSVSSSGQKLLADTRIWDKTMPLMQTLQMTSDVDYILKDIHNTHYVYLGTFAKDIKQIVSLLWGSSVDITNPISIQNNQLFGEKVTEITLPSYKNNLKKLLLVTFSNGDSRFVQIDRDWYASLQNKLVVQEKFEEFY